MSVRGTTVSDSMPSSPSRPDGRERLTLPPIWPRSPPLPPIWPRSQSFHSALYVQQPTWRAGSADISFFAPGGWVSPNLPPRPIYYHGIPLNPALVVRPQDLLPFDQQHGPPLPTQAEFARRSALPPQLIPFLRGPAPTFAVSAAPRTHPSAFPHTVEPPSRAAVIAQIHKRALFMAPPIESDPSPRVAQACETCRKRRSRVCKASAQTFVPQN